MNSAIQGEKALADSNAPLAVQHFTRALTELPRAPSYYIRRSTAYSRVKAADGGPNSQSALQDAEIALVLARERGKRELILSAQMRRAVSLFQLERYGDAKFVLELIETMTADQSVQDRTEGVKAAMSGSAAKKDGYSAELPIWMAKVRRKLRELGESDEKAAVSVVEYLSGTQVPTEKELKAQLENLKAGKPADVVVETRQEPAQQSTGVPTPVAEQKKDTVSPVAAPAPEKARHEWYQSQDSVVVTIYVKGVPKDKVETELKDESVSALPRSWCCILQKLTPRIRFHSNFLFHPALNMTSPSIHYMPPLTLPHPRSLSWVPRLRLFSKNRRPARNGSRSSLLVRPRSLPIAQRYQWPPPLVLRTRPRHARARKTGTRSLLRSRKSQPRTKRRKTTGMSPTIPNLAGMPWMDFSRSYTPAQTPTRAVP